MYMYTPTYVEGRARFLVEHSELSGMALVLSRTLRTCHGISEPKGFDSWGKQTRGEPLTFLLFGGFCKAELRPEDGGYLTNHWKWTPCALRELGKRGLLASVPLKILRYGLQDQP